MSTINLELLDWIAETMDGCGSTGSLICEREVEESQTVARLLGDLAVKNPRFQQAVFDIKLHQLNESVCLLVNGNLLDLAGGLETILKEGDSVVLVPFIQGG